MNYGEIVAMFKANYTEDELENFNQIVGYDSLKLANMGHNDVEGYQIFTPEFIVKKMCSAIGDDILDFSKNILEPTSGDGAFTVYILKLRLKKAFEGENFEIDALRALSTIYSIEMDEELIKKQRNNILTVFHLFAKKNHLELTADYYDLVKCIILSNFMWGMFNSEHPVDAGLFGTEVIYKMPEAEKEDFQSMEVPVWSINKDEINMRKEGVDLW